jgi:hypothetical protein
MDNRIIRATCVTAAELGEILLTPPAHAPSAGRR